MPAPDLPVTHGSIGGFYDKGLLFAFPPQLLRIVLELGVLCREDPGSGYEVVLLRLALAHSENKRTNKSVWNAGDNILHLRIYTVKYDSASFDATVFPVFSDNFLSKFLYRQLQTRNTDWQTKFRKYSTGA